jgi:hypothetical protein
MDGSTANISAPRFFRSASHVLSCALRPVSPERSSHDAFGSSAEEDARGGRAIRRRSRGFDEASAPLVGVVGIRSLARAPRDRAAAHARARRDVDGDDALQRRHRAGAIDVVADIDGPAALSASAAAP